VGSDVKMVTANHAKMATASRVRMVTDNHVKMAITNVAATKHSRVITKVKKCSKK
jgi:hypothetical protein